MRAVKEHVLTTAMKACRVLFLACAHDMPILSALVALDERLVVMNPHKSLPNNEFTLLLSRMPDFRRNPENCQVPAVFYDCRLVLCCRKRLHVGVHQVEQRLKKLGIREIFRNVGEPKVGAAGFQRGEGPSGFRNDLVSVDIKLLHRVQMPNPQEMSLLLESPSCDCQPEAFPVGEYPELFLEVLKSRNWSRGVWGCEKSI